MLNKEHVTNFLSVTGVVGAWGYLVHKLIEGMK